MDEQHEWLSRRHSRRALLKSAGVVGAASAMLWVQPTRSRAAASQVYGRHVTYGPDPRYQISVGFASMAPIKTAVVRLSSGQSARASGQKTPGSSATYFRASFELLQPDTVYQYNFDLDGKTVSGAQFRTAPAGPATFRFTAFGDQDVGPDSHRVLSRVLELNPMLHLMAGDLCYADSSGAGGPGDVFKPQRWDRWLDQNNQVASTVPWMVVPGNHEMEPGFGTHGYGGMLSRVAIGGYVPLGMPVVTAFEVGSVGFVGLDSNDVSNEIPANRGWTAGLQTQWLESTLAGYRRAGSGIDFVVVFHHSSPYSTSGTHGSEGGIREHWVPLYDKYGVDLVISGHNHCYERTLPLRGGVVTSHGLSYVDSRKGTTYVTAGGGGASFGAEGFGSRRLSRVATQHGAVNEKVDWSTAPRGENHSLLSVDVTPSAPDRAGSLHLRAITMNGRVMDEWTLARAEQNPSNPSKIWVPAGAALVAAGGAASVLAVRRKRAKPPTRRPLPVPQYGSRPVAPDAVEPAELDEPLNSSSPDGVVNGWTPHRMETSPEGVVTD